MVTRRLEFEADADFDDLQREFRASEERALRFERQLQQTERQLADYERQVNRTTQAQERSRRATDQARDAMGRFTRSEEQAQQAAEQSHSATETSISLLATLAGAAGAVAGPVAAGALSFVLFATVAAPSINKVLSAQSNLAESWDTLSARQKSSALLVRGLADDYHDLAESYEPQSLSAFNSIVGTAHALMPKLTKVVDGTTFGVQGFIGTLNRFAEGREVDDFLKFTSQAAPEALGLLGDTATTTGGIALQLLQDMAPLGLSMLQMANGTLSAVNSVAQFNPLIAQMAISTLLLHGPVNRAVTGVGNWSGRMRAAAAPAAGLTRSARALNVAAAAGPGLYIAAGAALTFLAVRALTAKSSTEKLSDAMKQEFGAIGNNIKGYQLYQGWVMQRIGALQKTVDAEKSVTAVGVRGAVQLGKGVEAARKASLQQTLLARDYEASKRSFDNVIKGADQLANRYGITQEAAIRLATTAGVDLSKSLDKSGNLSVTAALKVAQMKQAIEDANNPTFRLGEAFKILGDKTSTAKQRLDAYAMAASAFLDPLLALDNAAIEVKLGFQGLATAMKAGTATMGGSNAASLQLRQAFNNQIVTVQRLFAATREQTGSTEKARVAVMLQIPQMYRLAGGNAEARAKVDALARSFAFVKGQTDISRAAFIRMATQMGTSKTRAAELWTQLQKLKSRSIHIAVTADGRFDIPSTDRAISRHDGGPVPAIGPKASRARDSVPAMLRVDEHVWTPEEVDSVGGHGAMYRLRAAALAGRLQGYAKGGRVSLGTDQRSTKAVVGDVTYPVLSGYDAMITNMARAMAAAFKKWAASGNSSGAVRVARAQIGDPYVWGATGPNAFDCSGLTWYAWKHGGGKDITRTTYTQRRALRTIPSPIPGAVGQPHSGHTYMYSGNGNVIEAQQTGTRISEHRLTRSTPWWGYPYAEGGPADRALAADFVRTGRHAWQVKAKGLAGDPGGILRYGSGGWVGGVGGPDRNLIAATQGEYVVNRSAAGRNAAALEAMNAGTLAVSRTPVTGRAGTAQVHHHHHKTVMIQPGATNTIRDNVDIGVLAEQLDFLERGAEL